MSTFDLMNLVEYGGCSAKLPAGELERVLQGSHHIVHPNVLVGTETHDDAGVYKLSEDTALILTTDFFPPLCSDPYEFGQIAAANALSDVFAMGGEVLTALNLVAFPANAPLEVLRDILRGGSDKVEESGGVIVGGHTIVDETPKYGLAVTGKVHPARIITNAAAQAGDVLILTKAIGAGMVLAGQRIGEISESELKDVLESMKQLNLQGAKLMQKFDVKCATDITGFGLAGHALKLAKASGVSLEIETGRVPLFSGALRMSALGCIPGACFRNLEYAESAIGFSSALAYENKMILFDAQTSGGLLICTPREKAIDLLQELHQAGFPLAETIGQVTKMADKFVVCLE